MRTFMLVEVEPHAGARHELVPGTTIGREDCDIVLSDEKVSRRHAAFRISEHGIAIQDLDSRNGTYVNERRVDGIQALADDDTIRMGSIIWRLQASVEEETVVEYDRPAPASAAAGLSGERRGDVPAPEGDLSAVRSAPLPALLAPPVFESSPSRRTRGSAARSGAAAFASYGLVLLTAVALIAYFAAR